MIMKGGNVKRTFFYICYFLSSYLLTLGYRHTGKGHVLDQKEIPELRLRTGDGV